MNTHHESLNLMQVQVGKCILVPFFVGIFSQIGLQLWVIGGKEDNFTRSIISRTSTSPSVKVRTKIEKRNHKQHLKE